MGSVHQGGQDGVKGVYHINTVDCVTQYEGVTTCERISEAFLIPVLEALLQSFPCPILGFHSDNIENPKDTRCLDRLTTILRLLRLGIHQPPSRQTAQ